MILSSRSTWACELKWEFPEQSNGNKGSRSTWACELKWFWFSAPHKWDWSRSTWACELKCLWDDTISAWQLVTLHVSVWVEIETCTFGAVRLFPVTLHVSVWVEMRKSVALPYSTSVTLHVSVWVEIFFEKPKRIKKSGHAPRERVSWNCICRITISFKPGHALVLSISLDTFYSNKNYATRKIWS